MEKITAGHPLSQSEDIVKQNIDTLKALFPTIVKEGKIDIGELKALLGEDVEENEEYYRFTWAGKNQARQEANKPSSGTLRPNKAESKDWDTTQNIFIEGDNLEVLKLLQKSYAGKVKMIYIDPPYNTGKDFVYRDNYKDNLGNYLKITGQVDEEGNRLATNSESDGRYHSNWLNMMYPRLKLARNLLKDEGVIFISIDDNEVHNLRKVCDELFGEENFVGCFTIKSTPNARDYGHIGKMHEFVLFYTKNHIEAITYLLPDVEKTFSYADEIGGFNIHPLYNSNEAFHKLNRPNLYYPFYLDEKQVIDNGFYKIYLTKQNDHLLEIYPPKSVRNGVDFVWRWGKDKAQENLNIEIVGYKTNDGEFRIVQKMRTSEKVIRSIQDSKGITSRRGTAETEALLNGKIFSFPKPVELIYTFLKISTLSDDIVLDFFAGSGTTMHSLIKLNSEDGGTRKCISIQLPELIDQYSEAYKAGYKTIADITKERIRRAGERFNEGTKDDLFNAGKMLDLGFKAFKLDSSNINAWDGSIENFEQNLFNSASNIKVGRTEEDVLYEILLKSGLDLSQLIEEKEISGKKVYNIGLGALFICLADNISSEVAEGIGLWKAELNPVTCTVIFKDAGLTDVEKVNSIQILKRYGITEVNSI